MNKLTPRLLRSMMSKFDMEHLSQGSAKPEIGDPNLVHLYNMRLCPFSERAMLVLLAKDIPFEMININLKDKPDWFVESTPGTVPVVMHKGKIIPESLIGCDYLDEAFGKPNLNPSDPLQSALDKVVVSKVSGMMKFLYPLFAKIPDRVVPHEEKLELFASLTNHIELLETELRDRESQFLGEGNRPSMADFMIWPFFERVDCLPILLGSQFTLPDRLQYVNGWIKAMRETEPVKAYGMSPQRLAKATAISNEFADYNRAVKESAGL